MLETQTENKIKLPSKWQFFSVIPFAFLYTSFIILGNLEKASELSALHNIGRILLWLLVSYVLLLFLCYGISQRKLLMKRVPLLSKVPGKTGEMVYLSAILFVLLF